LSVSWLLPSDVIGFGIMGLLFFLIT